MRAGDDEERRRAAFLAAWPRDDGADQWWWLHHPGLSAPSGAASWEQRLAAARTPLYRREVDPADVSRYERLAAEAAAEAEAVRRVVDGLPVEGPPGEEPSPPGRPPTRLTRRRLVVGGLVLAAGGAATAVAVALPRPGSPAVVQTTRLDLTAEESVQLALRFGAAQASIGLHAERLRRRLQNDVDELDARTFHSARVTALPAAFQAPAPSDGVAASGEQGDALGTGWRTGDISTNTASARIDHDHGRTACLVVMLPTPGAWHAELAVRGSQRVRVVADSGRGAVQFAVLELPAGAWVTSLAVTGPEGVPFVWNLTLRR